MPPFRRTALAAALAVLALPAAASASASTVGITADGTLSFRGNDGATNALSVRELADAVEVTDAGGVKPTRPFNSFAQLCVPVSSSTVRCGHRPTRIRRIAAFLNDRNDTAGPLNTQLPVVVGGGDGNDTFEAGSPSFLTRVTFNGGSGVDTASYAGSQGVAGGRGVLVDNDGAADDGRIGLDADGIGRDVEILSGSAFADELVASEFGTTLAGGLGDDVLRAGAGFTTFDMGPAADGADQLVNGTGHSVVDYRRRTQTVNASIDFGGRDDGEAGEGDELVGRHEAVEGGQARDFLHAPRGSLASYVLNGNGGNDEITGASGNDRAAGGPGGDIVKTLGGDDRIVIGAADFDSVDCGSGIDTVELGGGGLIHVNCENRPVGVLRLAPKALRAEAGGVARLRLAWRHPRGWRQLRRVELRVFRGDARVGAITVRPRGGRVDDDGAVRLVRRATRLERKGETVSARLALRLDRSLAGRRLRVEVEAVDVRGDRQLERDAGSIRVAG